MATGIDRAEYQQDATGARAALGAEAFTALGAAGRALR